MLFLFMSNKLPQFSQTEDMKKSDKLWIFFYILLTKEYLQLRIKMKSFKDFDFH